MSLALDPTQHARSRTHGVNWAISDIARLILAIVTTQALFWVFVLGIVHISPLNAQNLEQYRVLSLETVDVKSRDDATPLGTFQAASAKQVLMPNPGLVGFNVTVKDRTEAIGVFIPRLADNAVLFVNGARLTPPKGKWGAKTARTGVVGMSFEVPTSSLIEGANRFELFVVRSCCQAFVNSIYAGPISQMRPIGAVARWFRIDLTWIIIATSVLIGLVAVSLVPLRRNLAFLWSVLACSATVSVGTYFYIDTGTLIPTIWRAWYGHILGALVGYLSFMCLVNAWTNGPTWLYRIAVVIGTFCVVVSAALVPFHDYNQVISTVRFMLVAVMTGAIGTVWLLLLKFVQTKETGRFWQSGLLLISSVAAVVDYVFALELRAQPIYFVPFSNLTLMTALGIALAQRGAQMFLEAEAANLTLAARISAKEDELIAAAAALASQERETAIQAERARIMRDVHDGMGGQLLSLLIQARDPDTPRIELEHAVEAAIEDLRLLVDSLDSVGDSLDVALAVFRDRLAPKMRACGVQLGWHNELTQPTHGHAPSVILNIYRILQEAMTNALRHSQAQKITISIYPSPKSGFIDIVLNDDGYGFATDATMGRGLTNMRRRAAEFGGQLLVTSSATGTTICLAVPT